MKKIIIYILLVLWMALIFFFSHQPDIESDKMSNGVIEKIINIVEVISNHEFSESELKNIYKYAVFPVRKLAHFTLYFVLGIFMYLSLKNNTLNPKQLFLISLILCFLYACSDEIHQLFVAGRSGNFKDVLIDTLGSFLSLIIASRITSRIKRNITNGE